MTEVLSRCHSATLVRPFRRKALFCHDCGRECMADGEWVHAPAQVLKLFVWENPFEHNVVSGYGMPHDYIFALAETAEQARELAKSAHVINDELAQPVMEAFSDELGEPTRILESPGAEWVSIYEGE